MDVDVVEKVAPQERVHLANAVVQLRRLLDSGNTYTSKRGNVIDFCWGGLHQLPLSSFPRGFGEPYSQSSIYVYYGRRSSSTCRCLRERNYYSSWKRQTGSNSNIAAFCAVRLSCTIDDMHADNGMESAASTLAVARGLRL